MTARSTLIFGLLLTGLVAGHTLTPARAAADIGSVYTALDLDACRDITPPDIEDGGIVQCAGFGGIDVRVAEGDLRNFVSYGPDAENQTAASQTVPAFNTIGKTLEWRVEDGEAFATILRFHWDSDGRKGSTLVVTKLGETDACHVAHIQAAGNPNANALAREIADDHARGFNCQRDRIRSFGPDGTQID